MNCKSDGQITIRKMQPGDIDDVLAVEQMAFVTPWSRDAFESELYTNKLACYLVLVDKDRVVGYAGMWLIIDEAHITNVAILPQYRGRGLGERLMGALMATAKAQEVVAMTLEVRVSNYVAQGLYAKLGFTEHGRRSRYYTDTHEDALIMWCEPLDEHCPDVSPVVTAD